MGKEARKQTYKQATPGIQKEKYWVTEFKKLRAKLFFIILSAIVSFFLVPFFIGIIKWNISIDIGENYTIDLDPIILYITLTFLIYVIFRIIYYYQVRKIYTR